MKDWLISFMIENNPLNSAIQGKIVINSEIFSAAEFVHSLQVQGIQIKKVGSQLVIGNKYINSKGFLDNQSDEGTEAVNPAVIHGLTSQIQRIFTEISKLKDQMGLEIDINSNLSNQMDYTSINDSSLKNLMKNTSYENKWESNKSFRQNNNQNTFNRKKSGNDVPILTLGKSRGTANLMDEYRSMTTSKGLSTDEALDSISTKLFSRANQSLVSNERKIGLANNLQANQNQAVISPLSNDKSNICMKCNSKVPNYSTYCSKCGERINV